MTRAAWTIVAPLFLLAACGGNEGTRAATARDAAGKPAEARATAETAPAGKTESARAAEAVEPAPPRGVSYGGNPVLTLYVEGPDPVANIDVIAGVYETRITVVNEGARPAELERARTWFEAWVGTERRECAKTEAIDLPDTVGPGEAHTFTVRALCPSLPADGDREVRTYVAFGAQGGDVDVDRYYAGRYFLE